MTISCFLTIVGARQGKFKGESSAAGHRDAIEALSIDYLVTRPFDAESGQPTAALQHAPIQFTKAAGAATPQLLEAMVTDEQVTTVTIDFVQSTGAVSKTVESLVITNAQIVSFRHRFDAGATSGTTPLVDHVALTFQEVQITNTAGKTTATDRWVPHA